MKISKKIAIVGENIRDEWLTIISALAQSCELATWHTQDVQNEICVGVIKIGSITEATKTSHDYSLEVHFSNTIVTDAEVQFGTGTGSPFPYRGRSVKALSAVPANGQVTGEVIATANGIPIWTSVSRHEKRHDVCHVPISWIEKGDSVFDHLNGSRFMNLLPILEWFRAISDFRKWHHPSPRACFMFDDPNLHSTDFGFINYQQLATEGKNHRYHTSFATVPLDGYYTNRSAAKICRENPETLSFLIHGNNHTKRELSSRGPAEKQVAQMRQAISRVGKIEKTSGIEISKVMAPPHGICSAEMMNAMRKADFEAVCVSHGSVRTGNKAAEWTLGLGAYPVTIVNGLPVIPRFGLNRNIENLALLAAYLNQPIVPVGHHWDLADGMEILSAAAKFINGIGKVVWSNMSIVARGNYSYRIQESTILIKAHSRVTVIPIPKGIQRLEMDVPWLNSTEEIMVCSLNGENQQTSASSLSNPISFPVTQGVALLKIIPVSHFSFQKYPHTPIGALVRRVLVEARDRSMPHFPKKWVRS